MIRKAVTRRKTTPIFVRRSYRGLSHPYLKEGRKKGVEGGREGRRERGKKRM
jgi:hypothetical protein